ncbi:hypothetical protein ELI44_01060 [Rhizobium ruizarguesonis]|nr:hypothetical protein [Rhizobium ruizarguesonis]NEJ39877.1 hypothetical protein [Rhizobium ruizarguesonis]TAU24890.1 hypothetical protein ELI48_01015 [Rhizobium ruizarguesonis]TAU46728.1 hypothetical protein ELI42_01050 [Rhizobium ruizarguesonis]TAU61800.1 hypothetical protein ELI44_01060 [Rhizobium ruizarguesonis]
MTAPHPNPLPVNGARGRALRKVGGDGEGAACPFAPQAGRRCRQADEGHPRREPKLHKKTGHSARFLHSNDGQPAQLARAAALRRSFTGW